MEPIKMTVLIDSNSFECLYVEGERWNATGEPTVFVCDLVVNARGRPMFLEHINVERPGRVEGDFIHYEQWPVSLEDAMKWRQGESNANGDSVRESNEVAVGG